jgi:hypothetical protein
VSLMFKQAFFSLPQKLFRGGIWRRLSPTAKDLYVALCHEAERRSASRLCVTDQQLRGLAGCSPRSLQSARRQLAALGLLGFERHDGGRIYYILRQPEEWQQPTVPTASAHIDTARDSSPSRSEVRLETDSDQKPDETNGIGWQEIGSTDFKFGANV